MEKIFLPQLSIPHMSRDSMKLALKAAIIHDIHEDSWPSSAEALNLDEETRQKLQQLCHDFSARPKPDVHFCVYPTGTHTP